MTKSPNPFLGCPNPKSVRAENKMAQEVDRAQANGEVRKQEDGINQHAEGAQTPGTLSSPATLKEIGITSQRIAEWRKTAEKPEAVEAAIQNRNSNAPVEGDQKSKTSYPARPVQAKLCAKLSFSHEKFG